ncbi:MAG: hypothetical protein ABEJ86_05270 [Halococcoides sp.]
MSGRIGETATGRLGQICVVAVAMLWSSGIVAGQSVAPRTPEFGILGTVIPIGLTVFAGIVLLGFVPDYGYGVIDTITENPFVTVLFGLGGLIAFVFIILIAALLSIIPIVGFIITLVVGLSSLVVLLLWTTAGYIAIGRFFAGLLGVENVWVGFAIGLVLATIVQVLPTIVAVPLSLPALFLGVGGGLRHWLGSGGGREKRSVPPATRV